MKILKNVAVVFALLLMSSFCLNAQNIDNSRCRDEDCVLEILRRLDTNDEAVIAETEKKLEKLAEEACYYDVYEIKNALKNSIFAFVEKFEDCKSNAFLVSLLSKLYSANESNEIMKLVENEKLADAAIRAVANKRIAVLTKNETAEKTRRWRSLIFLSTIPISAMTGSSSIA